jgi:peptidyl-prolyl cis-trans isomerase C
MRTAIKRSEPAREVAVNGAVIANAEIAREVQNHPEAKPKEAWEAATRALVVRELLLQRARLLNLRTEPLSEGDARETDEEALIRVLLETEVQTPKADEASCRRYYQANLGRFRSQDLFEPLHILFKAPRDHEPAFARATARAEAALAEVMAAPECFERFAAALSDCSSASESGRLGQVARGDTTAEFETALLSLEEGQVYPEPVRTRYGLHIVKLERKVAGEPLPFEQVHSRIATYLEESSWRRAVAQYVTLLAGEAQIIGHDMPGAATPLVQ